MANASRNSIGPATQGKRSGTGAMTDEGIVEGRVEENMVLSNRDKSRHSQERGLDSKAIQNDQLQDQPGNRLGGEDEG
jgi:hypothetical protein